MIRAAARPVETVDVAQAATGLGPATSFKARFTTTHTGASSGLALMTTGSAPACTASDAEIGAEGAEGACPASTRVGSGDADGLLDGTPTHFDIGIYSVRGHLVFAAEQGGHPLKQSFNGVASGRKLILTVPTLGGTSRPPSSTPSSPPATGKRAWLLTPKSCPRSRHWTSAGSFLGVRAASGGSALTSEQTLSDRSACR